MYLSKCGILLGLCFSLACASLAHSGEPPGNLIMNGAFEAGNQYWHGDGKVITLPDGNKVYQLEAASNRLRTMSQDFRMHGLKEIQVVFKARNVNYTGSSIRISIHRPGGGSVLFDRDLPNDGAWKDFHIKYNQNKAEDERKLVIAVHEGSGAIQIDDVEVRDVAQVIPDAPAKPATPPNPVAAKPGAAPTPPTAPTPAVPAPAVASTSTPAGPATRTPATAPAPPVPSTPATTAATASAAPPVSKPLPAGPISSLEEVLDSAPASVLAKFKDPAMVEEGVNEMNTYLAGQIKGKKVLMKVTVEKGADFDGGGTKKYYRLKIPDNAIGSNEAGIKLLWFFVYIPKENMLDASATVPPGSQITISGDLTRCDIKNVGGWRFHANVSGARIEP